MTRRFQYHYLTIRVYLPKFINNELSTETWNSIKRRIRKYLETREYVNNKNIYIEKYSVSNYYLFLEEYNLKEFALKTSTTSTYSYLDKYPLF